MKKYLPILFSIFCFLLSPYIIFAKTDLSISEADITFSKDDFLAGDTVKIYARVFNSGDTDVFGNVIFCPFL